MPRQPVAGALFLSVLCSVAAFAAAQTWSEPRYEVVSIKKHVGGPAVSDIRNRPDGGMSAVNVPVALLIARAYPPAVPIEMEGLPQWALRERYDVNTTASLTQPSSADRTTMLRAMLAERFMLSVHTETRPRPVYELRLARNNGELGPQLRKTDIDCAGVTAERNVAGGGAPAPSDLNGPTPPCQLRLVADRLDGDTTMPNLATMLRPFSGRFIVDKTGLEGFRHVTMTFDSAATRRGPEVVTPPDAPPSLFSAIQSELGLKLEPATADLPRLIVDSISAPDPN